MKTYFQKKVDLENRRSMIDFLTNHYRYYTLNSWNRSHSYAHNIKIRNLPINSKQKDKLFEMIETSDFWYAINGKICNFEIENDGWTVGFNGRSGGYIVLYQRKLENGREYITSKGVDEEMDFEDWVDEDLVDRVKIITKFDKLCDDILETVRYLLDTYDVKEKTIRVPQKIKVLKAK